MFSNGSQNPVWLFVVCFPIAARVFDELAMKERLKLFAVN